MNLGKDITVNSYKKTQTHLAAMGVRRWQQRIDNQVQSLLEGVVKCRVGYPPAYFVHVQTYPFFGKEPF